jgi:hypothetical protein
MERAGKSLEMDALFFFFFISIFFFLHYDIKSTLLSLNRKCKCGVICLQLHSGTLLLHFLRPLELFVSVGRASCLQPKCCWFDFRFSVSDYILNVIIYFIFTDHWHTGVCIARSLGAVCRGQGYQS